MTKTIKKEKKDNAISMMRGKSPPPEIILEKIKSNNSLVFEENLEREIISFFVKISLWCISSRTFFF